MKISNVPNTLYYSKNIVSQNSKASTNIGFTSVSNRPKSKLFEPVKKFFEPAKKFMDDVIYTKVAQCITKLLEAKSVKNIVEKTKNMDLVSHLMTFTSVVLSGFYIKQTLQNKDLDDEKKKTLAINQAIVCVLSAVGCYAADGATNKLFDKYISSKFEAINAHDPNIKKYMHGLESAKKIMIFGFIYRFIAPVFATPVANHIGNKLQEKKQAELEAKKQDTDKQI